MNRILLHVCALILVACGSPYPRHKEVATDVHLEYIILGEGDVVPTDSDSVLVRFRAARLGEAPGSTMSTEQWYLTKDLRSGALVPVLRRLHVGDSMSVIAPGRLWPWRAMTGGALPAPDDTTIISTELSLRGLRRPEEIRRELEALRRNDPVAFERRLIHAWVGPDTSQWTRWGTSDMRFHIDGVASDTARVQFGDVVHVQWTGRRLEDERIFDDVGQEGFTWRVGEQDQLIAGLAAAVTLLREGQEGTFILPSSLAFGARGIPGTLEGGSVVIYELRLVRVERSGTSDHRSS